MGHYYSRHLRGPFEEVIQKITQSLQQQGFGIVTTIDLKDTFRQKLSIDFRKYTILGACNPQFAYEAVSLDSHAGLMLPCNVVVQEHENGAVEISAISPLEMMDNTMKTARLSAIAEEVTHRLRTAVDDVDRTQPETLQPEALPADPHQHAPAPGRS